MASCYDCGKKLTLFSGGSMFDGKEFCPECMKIRSDNYKESTADANVPKHEAAAKEAAANQRVAEFHQRIDAIMLTTESAPNLNITKRIEIVTAECAFGMHIFKDLFAGVRDIVGGRSKAIQETMRDSRRTALYELKREAHAVGANAVVGVDLDYVELSLSGSMVMLVASGTAVVIEN